jgi:glycosyltransferase involved in cell wall biosynthesis
MGNRILLFTHEYPPIHLSGVGNTARYLSQALLDRGFEVGVVTPRFRGMRLPGRENKGPLEVRRLLLPVPENLLFSFAATGFSMSNRKFFSDAAFIHALDTRDSPLMCKHLPVILNSNDYVAADIPLSPFNFPWSLHDRPQRYAYYNFSKLIEYTNLKRAGVVIANSRYTADIISSKYGIRKDKFRVVYKGLTDREFPHAKKVRGQALFVGGNLECKGVREMLLATKSILRRHPQFRVLIAGGMRDGTYVTYLRECARRMGLEKSGQFLGHVEHKALLRMFSESELFILPTYREGLGQAVIEAMAAGLPVISTTVGGVPEIVESGREGLLVPPQDEKALADAMDAMLSDMPRAREMGQRGKEKAKRKFSMEGMIEGYMKIYGKFL